MISATTIPPPRLQSGSSCAFDPVSRIPVGFPGESSSRDCLRTRILCLELDKYHVTNSTILPSSRSVRRRLSRKKRARFRSRGVDLLKGDPPGRLLVPIIPSFIIYTLAERRDEYVSRWRDPWRRKRGRGVALNSPCLCNPFAKREQLGHWAAGKAAYRRGSAISSCPSDCLMIPTN